MVMTRVSPRRLIIFIHCNLMYVDNPQFFEPPFNTYSKYGVKRLKQNNFLIPEVSRSIILTWQSRYRVVEDLGTVQY